MSSDTINGTCKCGATVIRPAATGGGRWSEMMNGLPFWCARCIEEDERAEAERAVAAELERQRRAFAHRLAVCGLPESLREVDLAALDPYSVQRAVDAGRDWAEGRIKGLVLTGPYGVGKTTIAAGALRLMLARRAGRFVSAPLLLARLGHGGRDRENRDQIIDTLLGDRALILDDLDKVRATEYGAEQVFVAIDNAVSRLRPLLVTTNLSVSGLSDKWPEPFGDAIASRLAGYCQAVQMDGRDRRLR